MAGINMYERIMMVVVNLTSQILQRILVAQA